MQGQLFTQDFLLHGIRETPPYQALDEASFQAFRSRLQGIFSGLSTESTLNEAQTEKLLIEPVLAELGWGEDYLPQVNLSGKRREDVPDILLFADGAAYARAKDESKDDRRYRHGLAILEAKRWLRPLDRGDGNDAADPGAPSSQMLRYLSRAELVSDRAIKWGVLSNGAVWRLYYQDARSRSEEFFEVDLASALGVAGTQSELGEPEPAHALKLFFLFFRRGAFLAQDRVGFPKVGEPPHRRKAGDRSVMDQHDPPPTFILQAPQMRTQRASLRTAEASRRHKQGRRDPRIDADDRRSPDVA